ncbi:MAG: hypothetical protein O7G86_02515 [Gammaproteobacteria bacterium]|nr:hypothetical protein [Gammaproteobacteria bacterium]
MNRSCLTFHSGVKYTLAQRTLIRPKRHAVFQILPPRAYLRGRQLAGQIIPGRRPAHWTVYVSDNHLAVDIDAY